MDYLKLTAKQIAAKIRQAKLDPVELVEFHLERIQRLNPKINALSFINADKAVQLAKARRKEASKGQIRGNLHGVTFTVKEHFPVKGLPHSDGNLDTLVREATHSARVVELLEESGAICIGKGNMTEYGKGYITDNLMYGRTNNPFDSERTPGGSSGGDAAALAAGFSEFALAGDAGGSIRVPASYCGLFGLFPTVGGVTRRNSSLPVGVKSLMSCYGPIARSLEDIKELWQVLGGYDPLDFSSLPRPARPSQFKKGRFAFYTSINQFSCDVQIEEAMKDCVKRLTKRAFKASEITPRPIAEANPYFIVLAGPTTLIQEDMQAALSGKPRDLAKESPILQRLRQRIKQEMPPISAELLLTAWIKLHEFRQQMIQFFTEYDFILAPISATLPPKHGVYVYDVNGKQYQSQEVYQFASCANFLGLPALAIPVGLSKEGLPIGLQLIGPRYSEDELIKVAQKLGFLRCLEAT